MVIKEVIRDDSKWTLKNDKASQLFIRYFKEYISNSRNTLRTIKLNNYISELLGEKTSYIQVLEMLFPYLTASYDDKHYIILLSDNISYNDINLIPIFKLIRYGSAEIKKCPVIDNAIRYALSIL